MNLVLASQSPRRQELLAGIFSGTFLICPAQGEEVLTPGLAPGLLVEQLALEKMKEVQAKYPQDLILGADTVVALEGKILGKPKDLEEAQAMLTRLSGRTHRVYTGVALGSPDRVEAFHQMAKVTFRPLTQEQIRRYLDQGESLDKAGAYGIQKAGALLVQGIEGDFYTVMGLPLCRLGQALEKFGIPLWGGKEPWPIERIF